MGVGVGVGVDVGVTVGVLVAAVAVRATAVAACSSADGPQLDNNTPTSSIANPIQVLFFVSIGISFSGCQMVDILGYLS